MAGEIHDLSKTDASNSDSTKLGWPEGMKRSDVNNRARELEGAIRRWYEDPEWTRLLEEQNGPTLTVTKDSDIQLNVASSPATDVTAKFPQGARVRVSVSGGSAVEGHLGIANYSSPNTTVPILFPPIFASENPAGGSWSGEGTAGSPASDTLANVPVKAGTLKIRDTSLHTRGHMLTDDLAGNIVHPVDGNVGTIDYATGAILVNVLSAAFDSDVTLQYQHTEVVPASANRVDVFISHTADEAAMRNVGAFGGRVPLWEDFGGAAFKEEGPDGGLDADTVDGEHAQGLVDRATATRNFIANPSGKIAQRGTAIDSTTAFPNNDDAYTLDRWLLLSEINDDFDVNQLLTDGPESIGTCIELVSAASNPPSPSSDKGGIFQILTNEDTKLLAGQTVSLSFWAKVSGSLNPVDAAILTWGGTADSPTSDMVSAWNIAGTEPTWAASWTRRGFVSVTCTGTWTLFKIENVAIPAGVANLAIGIWADDNDFSVGDYLRISGIQLEIGSVVKPYREPTKSEQLLECMRFFQKTFAPDETPQQNIGDKVGALYAKAMIAATGGAQWRFPVPMFKVPTVVTYSPDSADANWTTGDTPTTNEKAHVLEISSASGLDENDAIHATVEAEL
jgi:hypothetical protein